MRELTVANQRSDEWTTGQVAQYLGLSAGAIHNWIKAGRLPAEKAWYRGKVVNIIRRVDVDALFTVATPREPRPLRGSGLHKGGHTVHFRCTPAQQRYLRQLRGDDQATYSELVSGLLDFIIARSAP